ncbi:Isopropylmalate isomerase large subunit [Planctomycetales bacterium 10988]|nr:Isopropylmalate isomerase large subunit [Planctomycetales bacterium 10988]
MKKSLAYKLIESHLLEGEMIPGEEIGIRIDQTLTQDATGTLVMLELEAMDLDRAKTEVSVQYVDHNLIQEDHKNPDDHLFLESACERFGIWFSRPGNGVSHPVHQENFGRPGKTLLGSDSHTPAAGALGMLAIGAGGLEVAMAIAGFPLYIKMPKIWGVRLDGELPDWVSAKDVVLEMLRRFDVDGGIGYVIEYYGPGLAQLSTMDRHVIANMGTELGATSTVFPADEEVRKYLRYQQREEDYEPWLPEPDCHYDRHTEIDLSSLVPLIAMPSSPGNVVTVEEVAGDEIYQAYLGSSANPGYRDFAIAAEILKDHTVDQQVSFDVNPSSRQLLVELIRDGHLSGLISSGARLHQAGCNGCIGMGQAPASGKLSLRTVPRNFPGRSGTKEDQVCLVSPETAVASAIKGTITDPRTLGTEYPKLTFPTEGAIQRKLLQEPPTPEESKQVTLQKGPNISSLPDFEPLPRSLELQALLKVGDDISTDEIMPAGARVLPYRSNIPRIAEFVYDIVDPTYSTRAKEQFEATRVGHFIIGGENYGQGSSREHAAIAPRYLGLRAVIAKSFARIHWQNLVNFGVLPLTFADPADYDHLESGDQIVLENLDLLDQAKELTLLNLTQDRAIPVIHDYSPRQIRILAAGSLINWAASHVG